MQGEQKAIQGITVCSKLLICLTRDFYYNLYVLRWMGPGCLTLYEVSFLSLVEFIEMIMVIHTRLLLPEVPLREQFSKKTESNLPAGGINSNLIHKIQMLHKSSKYMQIAIHLLNENQTSDKQNGCSTSPTLLKKNKLQLPTSWPVACLLVSL